MSTWLDMWESEPPEQQQATVSAKVATVEGIAEDVSTITSALESPTVEVAQATKTVVNYVGNAFEAQIKARGIDYVLMLVGILLQLVLINKISSLKG